VNLQAALRVASTYPTSSKIAESDVIKRARSHRGLQLRPRAVARAITKYSRHGSPSKNAMGVGNRAPAAAISNRLDLVAVEIDRISQFA
jgi:hypothetical protein